MAVSSKFLAWNSLAKATRQDASSTSGSIDADEASCLVRSLSADDDVRAPSGPGYRSRAKNQIASTAMLPCGSHAATTGAT